MSDVRRSKPFRRDAKRGADPKTLEAAWMLADAHARRRSLTAPAFPAPRSRKIPRAQTSALLEYYGAQARLPRPRINRKDLELQVPKTLSFIDAPDEALATLESFILGARRRAGRIVVDQRKCQQIDLCAGSVLVALGLDANAHLGTRLSGYLPKDAAARELVIATGFPQALNLRVPDLKEFQVLKAIHGPDPSLKRELLQSTHKEIAADQVTDHITRCYRRFGYDFTPEQEWFGKLLGELLTNAEDHGRPPHLGWWVASYLRKLPSESVGDCHVALFNFGPSLAQTIRGIEDPALRAEVAGLVRLHRSRGFFRKDRPEWGREQLWTLYALQEGVSRLTGIDLARRGAGTAQMITAFQELGKRADGKVKPRMCVVSGWTHVLFDGTYPLREMTTPDGKKRRVIAFNDENDLSMPPAAGTVTRLQRYFPGTIISIRFYIDPLHLLDRHHATHDHATH